jgi:hypothetical protein
MSDMRVKARTNDKGYTLSGGDFDMHNMRPADVYGKRLDPWNLMQRAKRGAWYKISNFFAVNAKGNSIHPYLDRYNLLINHVVNELGVGRNCDHEVYCSHADGAKQILVPKYLREKSLEGARGYLYYGGKIYCKKNWESESVRGNN